MEPIDIARQIKSNQFDEILIIIHPDDIVMCGEAIAEEYYKSLQEHIGKFKKIITHFFWPYSAFSTGWTKDMWYHDILGKIRTLLEKNTEHYWDNHLGKDLFVNVGNKYLIDSHGVDIYFGGGHRSSCLKFSKDNFIEALDWVIEINNHHIYDYEPLIYD